MREAYVLVRKTDRFTVYCMDLHGEQWDLTAERRDLVLSDAVHYMHRCNPTDSLQNVTLDSPALTPALRDALPLGVVHARPDRVRVFFPK